MFFRVSLPLSWRCSSWPAACTPGAIRRRPLAAAQRRCPLPARDREQVGPAYASPAAPGHGRPGRPEAGEPAPRLPGSYRFYVLDQPDGQCPCVAVGLRVRHPRAARPARRRGRAGRGDRSRARPHRRAPCRASASGSSGRACSMRRSTPAMKSGSITVGRSVARDGLLELRSYSREQELDADRVGVGYLTRAGYRGDAMVTPDREAAAPEPARGADAGRGADRRGPRAQRAVDPSRARRAADRAGRRGGRPAAGRERPARPISRRSTACRSTIRRRKASCAAIPSSIRCMRSASRRRAISGCSTITTACWASARDRSLLWFSCTAGPDRRAGSTTGCATSCSPRRPTSRRPRSAAPRLRSAPGRAAPTRGLGQVRYVLIRRPDGVCYFNLLSDGPDRDRRIDDAGQRHAQLPRPVRGRGGGAAALSPARSSPGGARPRALAARMPYRRLQAGAAAGAERRRRRGGAGPARRR